MCACWTTTEKAGPYARFFVVILLCAMALGCTMLLEGPSTLRTTIQKELKLSDVHYQLHHHLLLWPNIFLLWLAGYILDRCLDVRIAAVVYLTISVVGCTLYTIGAVTKAYLVMLIGRLLTGLGVEASYICISSYIFRWFSSKFTNTVFALSRSVSLLGMPLILHISSSLLRPLSNTLERNHALSITVAVEMGVVVLPLACAVMLALISKPRGPSRENSAPHRKSIKISDIKKFPIKFWFLSITVNIFLSSCFIFLKLKALTSKYGLNNKQIELLVNTFSIGACVMGPAIGLIVDCKGRNLTYITLAFFGALISHFAFAFTITDPFYPIILLSLSYSMVIGSYWPLYTYVVKKQELNTALGIDQSIFMLCCAIGIIAAPKLKMKNKNPVEIYYLIALFIALLGSSILWGLDYRSSNLNQPKNIKEKKIKRRVNDSLGRESNAKEFKLLIPCPQRIRIPEITKQESSTTKPTNEFNYLRLKKIEAEGNMYKHQRKMRQTNRTMDRRQSKSSQQLYTA